MELIVKQVKDIPDYEKLKQDIELILLICSMIETITTDSDVKIDKLEAIVGIYKVQYFVSTRIGSINTFTTIPNIGIF